jgi:hypothetical protein
MTATAAATTTATLPNDGDVHDHDNDTAATTLCIRVDDDPAGDGLRVCGVRAAPPVAVSPSSLPWSLFRVTNATGTM